MNYFFYIFVDVMGFVVSLHCLKDNVQQECIGHWYKMSVIDFLTKSPVACHSTVHYSSGSIISIMQCKLQLVTSPGIRDKYTGINLNIYTSTVGIGARRAEILSLRAQSYVHLTTRGLEFWPEQIIEAQQINHNDSLDKI